MNLAPSSSIPSIDALFTLIQFSIHTLIVWAQRSLTGCCHMRRADVWEVWARQAWRTVELALQVALRALTELSLMIRSSLGPAVQSQ